MNKHRVTTNALLLIFSTLLISPASFADVVTLAPEADARILAVIDDRRPEFLAVYNVGSNIQRSLIRFDLSDLPEGTVLSAELSLFANIEFGSNPNELPMEVFRLTRDWVEAEATWDNASDSTKWTNLGGDFVGRTGLPDIEPYSVSTANPILDDEIVSWDITPLIREWHDGAHDNNGLLLLSQPGNKLTFRGTGFAASSVHPRLEVTFTPVPEPRNGDFNGDAIVDLADINLLGIEIASGTNRSDFDLNSDQIVNRTDLSLFLGGGLIDGGNKLNGDADFDGTVGFSDFLILSFNFGLKNRTWGEGDFDANGDIEFPDFLVLSNNFGRSAASVAATSIPEPSGSLVMLLGAWFLSTRRHRGLTKIQPVNSEA